MLILNYVAYQKMQGIYKNNKIFNLTHLISNLNLDLILNDIY